MRSAPLSRRLGAMLYDGLLVVALMMFATVPFVIVRGGESVEPGDPFYRLIMLIIAWLFFAGFWSRSGRTLGLQAWRLRIETTAGERPGFGVASLRFLAALVPELPPEAKTQRQPGDEGHQETQRRHAESRAFASRRFYS